MLSDYAIILYIILSAVYMQVMIMKHIVDDTGKISFKLSLSYHLKNTKRADLLLGFLICFVSGWAFFVMYNLALLAKIILQTIIKK